MRVAVLYRALPFSVDDSTEELTGQERIDDMLAVRDALVGLGHDVTVLVFDCSTYHALASGCFDAVFNLCDEVPGVPRSEPYVAGLLEVLGVPFSGSGMVALAMCMDKGLAKGVLRANGIPTPGFQVIHSAGEELDGRLVYPLITKPLFEDGSEGITNESVVEDESGLRQQARILLDRYGEPVLAEEFIDGRELAVSILGNHGGVLAVSEILFEGLPPGVRPICSHDAKWNQDSEIYHSTVPRCPARLEPEAGEVLCGRALESYRLLGCTGYGRVDFRLRDGTPYVIDVNPNPDISLDAGFFRAARAAGYSYAGMIERILAETLEAPGVKPRNTSAQARRRERDRSISPAC